MGFFKKLFKRKKGGTFFGNLLRGAAGKATGGILGSGAGLAKWEQKQAEKEYQQQMAAAQPRYAISPHEVGQKVGSALKPHVDRALASDTANDINKAFTKAWFRKNMAKLIGGAVGLGLLVFGVIYLSKGKRKKRGVV